VDDGFTTDTKTAKIVIGDSNLPPVIDSMEAQSIDENSELSFEISASDPNNNKLSFSYPDDLPSGATLTMSSSSVRFEWTPSYEQAGNYKVEFRVSDNSKYSFASYEVVDITVSDVNRPPVIDAVDDYSISENSVLYINLSGNDPDNDPLTFSTDSTLETVRGNLFTFSPDYSDAGVYNIQFTASDGSLSDSTTATITVTDANMPPKINSINPLKVAVNTTLEFSLSVSDDEKDALTYMALDLPSDANFDDSKALFEWTPSSSQIGDYSVSFHVSDASFEDYETVSITVVNESSSSGDTTSSSSSGSGGGGGSQNTGEKYENIDLKDYSIKSVMRDVETIFEFDEPANNIVSISFVSRLNGGQTKALIEILKGTSTLVNSAPAGKVYKNLNIWIGDSKFPSDMIYDVVITFRVDKSWIHSNELDSQSVKLYRYSGGMWNSLETSIIDEDGDYFYYEAKSPGFSPFAIVIPDASEIIMEENSSFLNETKMSVGDNPVSVEDTNVSQDSKKSLILLFLIGLIVAVAVVGIKYRSQYEKLYMQIGNPDGKRYRRIKK
jgi:hypothetical protein